MDDASMDSDEASMVWLMSWRFLSLKILPKGRELSAKHKEPA